MWGEPRHVSRLAEVVKETHSAAEDGVELDVLVAETNSDGNTYDGIDWGAERVIKEVRKRVSLDGQLHRKVTRFSIFGYSLGGLVARYTVGILYATKFFDDVTPVNFATIATPHIGLTIYRGSFLSRMNQRLVPLLLSRTGKQFYAKDNDDWGDGKGKPLVEVMSEKDSVFFEGLSQFKHIIFVANAIDDVTVSFATASVEPYDPFSGHAESGIEVELDERYAPIIKSFKYPDTPPTLPPKTSFFSIARFKAWWDASSALPRALQIRFPFNVLFYILLPIIIPVVLLLVISNFTWNSLKSCKRIRILEAREPNNRSAILQFVSSLGYRVEDAVVGMMEDETSQNQLTDPEKNPTTAGITPAPTPGLKTRRQSVSYAPVTQPPNPVSSAAQPALTPLQLRVIENLNQLPGLHKAFVWLDGLMNTHAAIICRDVDQFEFHRRGEGVLKYLADGFEM
ncbi:hypothetical protein M407DRAFT_220150 [Tulasnella calospora MUT 4182]|uniref:DUF676 domain-containing protein n=1 Tax=Tulasnella calospora MUT 4182 TaxID=1051891 RepID=A0A0C3LGP5_9AGAM|nr:hypothetical protein M407DRAFT_220150 [Tulasnella calospora MUT 4182]